MLIAADVCGDELKIIIGFIKTILLIVQIIIPILLIIWLFFCREIVITVTK